MLSKKSKVIKKVVTLGMCALMAVSSFGMSASAATVSAYGVGITSNSGIAEMSTSPKAKINIRSTFTYYNAKGKKVSSTYNDTKNTTYLARTLNSKYSMKKVSATFYRNGSKLSTKSISR